MSIQAIPLTLPNLFIFFTVSITLTISVASAFYAIVFMCTSLIYFLPDLVRYTIAFAVVSMPFVIIAKMAPSMT
jgi:hypothetical protein